MNDPERQYWNYPELSCPSGPSARVAGIVTADDGRRFEVSEVETAGIMPNV